MLKINLSTIYEHKTLNWSQILFARPIFLGPIPSEPNFYQDWAKICRFFGSRSNAEPPLNTNCIWDRILAEMAAKVKRLIWIEERVWVQHNDSFFSFRQLSSSYKPLGLIYFIFLNTLPIIFLAQMHVTKILKFSKRSLQGKKLVSFVQGRQNRLQLTLQFAAVVESIT